MAAPNPNKTLDRVLLALVGIVVLIVALKFASGAIPGSNPATPNPAPPVPGIPSTATPVAAAPDAAMPAVSDLCRDRGGNWDGATARCNP